MYENETIGIIWVPQSLTNKTTSANGQALMYESYTFSWLQRPDANSYLMNVRHVADNFSLLERWTNTCNGCCMFMLYNNNGQIEYWQFNNAMPYRGETNLSNRVLALHCSENNVSQISALPPNLYKGEHVGTKPNEKVEIGGYRRALYY